MKRQFGLFLILFLLCTIVLAGDVYVNRQKLAPDVVQYLQQQYGEIAPGRYWYDPIAGLWGYENGPTQGKVAPGVAIGGALPEDISGGGTSVFINGRELHPKEVAYLRQQFGYVNPGRNWLNNNGVGGYEGGPAMFQLKPPQQRRSSILTTRDLVGGSVVGGGFLGAGGGPSVTCGPDGGCIY
jgi:hypothetical protein